ncbi:MAG: hypothetical protein A2007_03275 [Verrucomicrobia bacterium GWC2_42_7]|nr:MAG: hypothetical protein A2007_03275 [Verrucomicrobia bacterium GWC2_42_7]
MVFSAMVGIWNYNTFNLNLKNQILARSQNIAHSVGFATQIVHHSYELQRMVYALAGESDVDLIIVVSGNPLKVIACNKNHYVGMLVKDLPCSNVVPSLTKIFSQTDETIATLESEKDVFNYFLSFYLPDRPGFSDVETRRAAAVVQLDVAPIERLLINQGISTTIFITVFFTAFVFLGYFLLQYCIILPIEAIQQKLRDRREGDPQAWAPVRSNDEIGILAVTLNAMVRAQEESEDLFGKLSDLAPVLLWMSDKNNRIFYFSKKWLQFTGKTLHQELGSGWLNDLHSDAVKKYREVFEKASLEKRAFTLEHRLRRYDGEYRWMLTQAIPRFFSDNSFEGYIGCAVDITERKESEKKLQQYADDLAEARDHAVKLANSKSDFLATMSHEIRTPMNALLGFLYLLQDTPLDKEQQSYLASISSSANLLLELINQILDFSKIEAGRLTLEEIPFNLHQCIREIADLFHPILAKKSIDFPVEIGSSVSEMVIGDAMRLRQVLINLIGNAIKFTSCGFVKLALNAEAVNSDAVQLIFSVQDTGIGIDEADQKRIFEPFTQADSSTTRKFGGTGLGLAISSTLIRMMGGELSLVSNKNEGSTFSFSIEAKIPQTGEPSKGFIQTMDKSRFTSLKNKQIVCAEDNEDNRIVLEKILQRYGISLISMENGRLLLEYLKDHTPDLILMDIQMPELDGYNTTQRIRKGEVGAENKNIPIIAFTAYATPDDRRKSLDAGVNSFITKPINPRELLTEIEKFLKKRTLS